MKCYQITGPDGGKSFLLCESLGLRYRKIFERNSCVIEELTTGFGAVVRDAQQPYGQTAANSKKLEWPQRRRRIGETTVTRRGVLVKKEFYEFEDWLMYVGVKLVVLEGEYGNLFVDTRKGLLRMQPFTQRYFPTV